MANHATANKHQKLKTSNKSEIAVLKIELEANIKGYSVSLPKDHSSRYDLILDDGKRLYRVQSKYLNRLSGRKKNCLELLIEDKSRHRKCYTNKEIDLLLIYIAKLDCVLGLYPTEFHNKKTLWFNLNNPKAPTYYKKFIW